MLCWSRLFELWGWQMRWEGAWGNGESGFVVLGLSKPAHVSHVNGAISPSRLACQSLFLAENEQRKKVHLWPNLGEFHIGNLVFFSSFFPFVLLYVLLDYSKSRLFFTVASQFGGQKNNKQVSWVGLWCKNIMVRRDMGDQEKVGGHKLNTKKSIALYLSKNMKHSFLEFWLY